VQKHRTVRETVEPSIYAHTDANGAFDFYSNETAPLASSHHVIESEGHPHRLLGRQSRGKIGGPFTSHKVEIDIGQGDYGNVDTLTMWTGTDHAFDYHLNGKVVPGAVASIMQSNPTANQIRQMCPTSISDVDLGAYGATAISLCSPRSPLADASSTIGELKDGLPHFPNPTGNVGGEYLNVVFGIQPILQELKDYHSSWLNAEKLLDQLEKDSGKWIRRGFRFNPTRTSSSQQMGYADFALLHGQVPNAYLIDGSSRSTIHTHEETKIWFSGAFTYHLPKEGWRRKLEEFDYLYGVKPGVDTAWELMPWSWLIDWYANVGDVLHNVNAFTADGLVMPYGYIMCTQTKTVSYDYSLYHINAGGNGYLTTRQQCAVKYTTKQRLLANPFGFGISFDALSGRQLAILAALGISRA
jgi:hypothetical protein